jgi:small-conductance mechanosensitive channel
VGITHGTHGIAQGSGGIKHKLSSPPKAYDYSTCIEAIIPNEMLVSQAIQNFSLSDRHARISSTFKLAHGTDIPRLLEAIPPALAALTQVLDTPAPTALLLSMGPEGLEVEAAVWVDDPVKLRGSMQSTMNLALLKLLNEQKVNLSSILPAGTSQSA